MGGTLRPQQDWRRPESAVSCRSWRRRSYAIQIACAFGAEVFATASADERNVAENFGATAPPFCRGGGTCCRLDRWERVRHHLRYRVRGNTRRLSVQSSRTPAVW